MSVFPCRESFSNRLTQPSTSIPFFTIRPIFPKIICCCSNEAMTPKPGKALKFWTSPRFKFFCLASLTTASANGCSDFFSSEATYTSKFSLDIPAPGFTITSITSGVPWVRVPVLSKKIASNFPTFSRISPPFTSTPNSAPLPVPTIIAVGVAKPNAQGQAITIIDIKIIRANIKGGVGRLTYSPKIHQPKKEKVATPITKGTKILETLSTKRCIGAFDPCASITRWTIFDRTESLPKCVARILNAPVLFKEPPITISSGFLSTGTLSPLIIDSSMDEAPLMIIPSTGIFSPGLTVMISPCTTSITGISISTLSRSTLAVLGCSPINSWIALEAFVFAFASSNRPIKTSVIIITEESK